MFRQLEFGVRPEMAARFARPVFSGPPTFSGNSSRVPVIRGYGCGYMGRFEARTPTGLELSTAPGTLPRELWKQHGLSNRNP
jgi:hypothetical protein